MKSLHFVLGTICAVFFGSFTLSRAAAPAAPDYVKVAWIFSVWPYDIQDHFLVRWLPVANATAYNVYRYDTNTASWVTTATNLVFDPWNVLSFRDPAPGDTNARTYAVSALNADGESIATSASVTPGPGLPGNSTLGDDWWPKGYTFIDPSFSYSWEEGCDGMFEFSVDGTNFTHGAWDTNINMFHTLHVTNLTPGTVWRTRLTKVDPNGIGISGHYPPYGIVTLFTNAIDVWEDLPNQLTIGSYPSYWPPQLFTPALHGSVLVGAYPWEWGYTSEPNFNGIDTFQILDNPDGPPVTITLNVQAVNDFPVASPLTIYVAEDSTTEFAPPVVDPENDPYSLMVVTPAQYGSIGVTSDTNFMYIPQENFTGTDEFTYYAQDYGGYFGQVVVTGIIIVTNVNDAPVATNQFTMALEDTPLTFTLGASDVDGDVLSVEFAGGPTHGTMTNNGLSVTYTPNLNYHGADSFTYRVSDGQVASEWKTVDLLVNPVNDAPTADNKSASTTEDQSVGIALTGADIDGDNLTFVVVTPPQHGQFTGGIYIPAANYYGSDSFTYKANDGQVDSAVATVTITIAPVNDAPVADSKSAVVNEDGSVAVALTGSDVEGSALTFAVVTPPAHGTFVNGTYTPAPNYHGPDSFTYKANDGQADSPPATVSITVTAVNDAPVANSQSVSTPYNTAVNIVLTGSDVEGSALTFNTLTSPANGTLTGTVANRTFTPNIGWSGTTSFTFKVNDGALDSTTATVTITVAAPTGVPAAPSGLTATAVSQNQINLAWTDNSNNEDGFKIERSPNGNSGWTQIATVGPGVNTFSNTGLTKNTRHYYRVRAHNALGNSAYSNTANARTLN